MRIAGTQSENGLIPAGADKSNNTRPRHTNPAKSMVIAMLSCFVDDDLGLQYWPNMTALMKEKPAAGESGSQTTPTMPAVTKKMNGEGPRVATKKLRVDHPPKLKRIKTKRSQIPNRISGARRNHTRTPSKMSNETKRING
jgi:hypothetical protein